MNKYEKLIEYIINDEQDKAKALFHSIVVDKSRKIYEGLMDEELGGNQSQGMIGGISNEVEGDEIAQEAEGDEFGSDEFGSEEGSLELGGDDLGDELGGDDLGDELGGDEFGAEEGEGSVEDRVMDLESALDELKAEFDELMASESGEAEHDEFGSDDLSDEEGSDADFDSEGDDTDFDSDVEESMVREYVEQVNADPFKAGASEGDAVGSGGKKSPINAKSPLISGKNDMGGTTKNIAKGGSEANPDGKSPTPKPTNEYTKGQGNLKGAGKFENVPGANTKGYQSKEKKWESESGKEGQTTKDSMSVDKKSLNPGGKPGFRSN
jgi:hypothetical protein